MEEWRPRAMKFTVSKEKLLEGLQQVQSVVSTRTTLPILSNVLLQGDGNTLRMTTTDLDIGVRCSVEAAVARRARPRCQRGACSPSSASCRPATCSSRSDGKERRQHPQRAIFFKILGLPEEDSRRLPKFEGAKTFTLPQSGAQRRAQEDQLRDLERRDSLRAQRYPTARSRRTS